MPEGLGHLPRCVSPLVAELPQRPLASGPSRGGGGGGRGLLGGGGVRKLPIPQSLRPHPLQARGGARHADAVQSRACLPQVLLGAAGRDRDVGGGASTCAAQTPGTVSEYTVGVQ